VRACVRAWVRGVSMCVFGATLIWYKEKTFLFGVFLVYFVTIWLWQMICTWLLKCGVKYKRSKLEEGISMSIYFFTENLSFVSCFLCTKCSPQLVFRGTMRERYICFYSFHGVLYLSFNLGPDSWLYCTFTIYFEIISI